MSTRYKCIVVAVQLIFKLGVMYISRWQRPTIPSSWSSSGETSRCHFADFWRMKLQFTDGYSHLSQCFQAICLEFHLNLPDDYNVRTMYWVVPKEESPERCSKVFCGFLTIIQSLRQSLRFAYVSQVLAYGKFWAGLRVANHDFLHCCCLFCTPKMSPVFSRFKYSKQTSSLHPGRLTWNMSSWRFGRSFSFLNGWLVGSMLIFQGVYTLVQNQ